MSPTADNGSPHEDNSQPDDDGEGIRFRERISA